MSFTFWVALGGGIVTIVMALNAMLSAIERAPTVLTLLRLEMAFICGALTLVVVNGLRQVVP